MDHLGVAIGEAPPDQGPVPAVNHPHMLDHPQSPVAELKGQEVMLTAHMTQEEVCPIVISVGEHILDIVGLRKKGALIVGRRGTSRKNVPS